MHVSERCTPRGPILLEHRVIFAALYKICTVLCANVVLIYRKGIVLSSTVSYFFHSTLRVQDLSPLLRAHLAPCFLLLLIFRGGLLPPLTSHPPGLLPVTSGAAGRNSLEHIPSWTRGRSSLGLYSRRRSPELYTHASPQDSQLSLLLGMPLLASAPPSFLPLLWVPEN